jgi:hypothetical protein
LKDLIERETGQKCWIDLDGIESDQQFANVIINAINNAETVLFMYSQAQEIKAFQTGKEHMQYYGVPVSAKKTIMHTSLLLAAQKICGFAVRDLQDIM